MEEQTLHQIDSTKVIEQSLCLGKRLPLSASGFYIAVIAPA
ncbi:hypothetical protein [Bradyrhizobium sp. SBR1B]|nr:hypothetical protein [Bradyrhizobium sp. SBR1B]MBB4383345.1 hypothetical protein [Bradyrhizobium sp. SBR1B]